MEVGVLRRHTAIPRTTPCIYITYCYYFEVKYLSGIVVKLYLVLYVPVYTTYILQWTSWSGVTLNHAVAKVSLRVGVPPPAPRPTLVEADNFGDKGYSFLEPSEIISLYLIIGDAFHEHMGR